MRILVLSDSHGMESNVRRAILAQPTADIVIHLGDGEEEMRRVKQSFPEKMFLQARGNCDWGVCAPYEGEYTQDGVKIFYTHGHLYHVKSGLYNAVLAARDKKAQVLLYGHTHQALTDYDDGLYIMNPGAIGSYPGTYGTLDITPQGIVTNVIRLP